MQDYLSNLPNNYLIGFVPTMGALHQGHISLVNYSKKSANVTVCSIFVNPSQFNDKADLERYPRMPEKDSNLLKEANCDILFLPDVSEIYPSELDNSVFNIGYLDTILEGKHRPGHFAGVAQVVSRLFSIVKPNLAFFGSKDYQQVKVVEWITKLYKLPVKIVSCPIVREKDGLAMSSRNMLLSTKEREYATIIFALLSTVAQMLKNNEPINSAKLYINTTLTQNSIYKLEYFEVANRTNLMPQLNFQPNNTVLLIACYVGKIRLIDNLEI